MSGREHDGPHQPPPVEHHELEPEYLIEELDGPHAEHDEPVSVSRAESDDWLDEGSSTDTGVTNYRVPPRRERIDAASLPPAQGSVQPRPRAGDPFLSPQHFTTQPLGTTAPLPNDRAPRSSGSFVIPEQRRARPAAADGCEDARQRIATPMPAVAAVQGRAEGPRRGSVPPPPPVTSQPSMEARHPSVPPEPPAAQPATRTLVTPPPTRPAHVASHSPYEPDGQLPNASDADRNPARHASDSRDATPLDVRPRPLPRSAVGHTRLLITPPPPRTDAVAPSVAATAPAASAAAEAPRTAGPQASPSDAERTKLEAARAHAIFAFARALADVPHHGAAPPSTDSERASLEAARSSAIYAFARALVDVAPHQAVPARLDAAHPATTEPAGNDAARSASAAQAAAVSGEAAAAAQPAPRTTQPPPLPTRPSADAPARARRDSGRATLPPPLPTRIDVDAQARAASAPPPRAASVDAEVAAARSSAQPQPPAVVAGEAVQRPSAQPQRPIAAQAEVGQRPSAQPQRPAAVEAEVVQRPSPQPQRPITVEAEVVQRPSPQPQRPITVEAEVVQRPSVQPPRATSADPERMAAATEAAQRVQPVASADPGSANAPPLRAARADGERISTPPPPPPATARSAADAQPRPTTISGAQPPRTTTGSGARVSGHANDDANSALLRTQLQQALARARSSELRLAQAELRARRAELMAQQLSEAPQPSHETGERSLAPASPRRSRFQFLIWCAVCFSVGGYVSLLVPIRHQMLKQEAALRELNQQQSLAVEAEHRRCEAEQQRLDGEKQELAQKLQELQDLPTGKAPPPLKR